MTTKANPTRTSPTYPDVTVQLTMTDGNAFAVIGAVSRELKRAGLREAANEWANRAMACESYDDVLRLAMATVDVQ